MDCLFQLSARNSSMVQLEGGRLSQVNVEMIVPAGYQP